MRSPPRAWLARPTLGGAFALLLALVLMACAPATEPSAGEIEPGPAPEATEVAAPEDRVSVATSAPREAPAADPLAAARAAFVEYGGADSGAASASTPAAGADRDAEPLVLAAVEASIIRVNVGGAQLDGAGVVWLEDRFVRSGGAVFANEGLESIANTDADAVYRTERNTGADEAAARIDYAVPVEPGRYRVVLHFAEIYFGTPGNPAAEPGQRVFHVELQGDRVLADYDILVAAGGPATAVTESFLVDADGGVIEIVVRNGPANRGKISAFEIAPIEQGG